MTESVETTPNITVAAPTFSGLRYARALWFGVTAIGLWVFVYFIVAYYFGPTVRGEFEAWNNKPHIDAYVANDTIGNLMFIIHVSLAGVMSAAGTLQLIPQLRNRAPIVHRVSGRAFLLCAFVLAIGGLWLVWVRGTRLGIVPAVAISIDAVLIVTFGVAALRAVFRGDIAAHRRWALRTFVVANGVWMLRVGFMFWALVAQGAGMTKSMSGPFDTFWAFGCYLVPLGFLELYFLAARGGTRRQAAFSVALAVGALATAVGIVGAYLFMWRPYL